jgi:Domain of unknown function (DUF4328)
MNTSPTFGSFVSPRSRARITKALLIAGAVVSAVSMLMGAFEMAFPTLSPEAELEENPGGLLVALAQLGIGSLGILIFIATAVFFLMWLYRSYENLPRLGTPARNISYSSGWAVGSFFIPFVSLVVPYRAVKELWRNSTPTDAFLISESAPAWFPLWWTFWLLSTFASRIYSRMVWRDDMSREVVATVGVLTDALSIIAAIFAIVVVEEITRRQEEASTSRGLGQLPNQPPPPPTFEGRRAGFEGSGNSEVNL